ncbi:MAG TPA: Ig domain-containing protein [Solirubrobacterales bacterium]|nr:Ig domain-containing protein [Solirubrobacterales bacterium]
MAVKVTNREIRRIVEFLVAVASVSVLINADSASAATHTQAIDVGNSLNAVSCVPGTTTCIAANSQGDALYATDVSATAAATWTPWSGPSDQSPSEAVECPASTLCLLAAGQVEGGGGNLYRATTLGGAFSTSVLPANGIGAISCPSASFCVTANEGGGFIRYSTNPSGISWTAVSIGAGAMKDVSCLSSSFCAVVDDSGNVHVATTEQGIKEAAGWTSTNVDGTTALRGVACSSTTSCIAVDRSGEVLELTIDPTGEAVATRQAIDGAKELAAVSCTGSTCAVADGNGSLFSSTNAGEGWAMRYGGGDPFTSVSCGSASLCAAATTSGKITTLDPSAIVAPLAVTTNTLPAGVAGAPYEAQVEATGGTPPYRWSATGLPPGLSIDQASGRITGIPLTAICVRWPCPQPPASYAPIVTVADSDGIPASRQLTISLAGRAAETAPGSAAGAPVVTELRASHRVWRVGSGLARISKRHPDNRSSSPVGTTFSFRLDTQATVVFEFSRRLAGRKEGGRCIAETSRNRKGEACRRTVPAGALSFSGHPGVNRVVFSGRFSQADKLSPGRYMLTVIATGSGGQRSAATSLSFRVVR